MTRVRTIRIGLWRKAFGLLCVAPSNVRVPCFSVGFRIPPLKSTPSSGNKSTRRLRMDLAAAPQAELLVLARFVGNNDSVRNRLHVILCEMAAKYQGRVATQLHGDADEEGESQPRPDDSGPSSPSDRASFRFMRGGLAIDEYRPCGNTTYEQELHKRVVAALSLSQPRDITTLRNLWPPAGTAGAYQDEMAVGTYAVQVASTVARELQGELCQKGAISKMDSSPVTVADFSVQAIVLGILECYFPGHGFIAEETSSVLRGDPSALGAVLGVVGKALCRDLTEGDLCAAIDLGARGYGAQRQGGGSGGRTWVLDPIDGTKGFLRGEQFCVALGLLDDGKAVAGLLGCPNLTVDDQSSSAVGDIKETETSRIGHESRDRPDRGLIYTAALGGGSFVRALSSGKEQARRVEVDRARQASETRVLESVESGHSSHGVAAQVSGDLGIESPSLRVDGQCKYGLLSQGQGGIYLRLPRWGYVENIWDHVAGTVVIQEAGGKVTDSRGESLDFSLGAKLPREVVGIVATNGNIHGEVIRAVHRRHVEDWSRVVSEAKREAGEAVPPLPGIEWAARSSSEKLADDKWWAAAWTERRPLAMKTSDHFYCALERGWDKLVIVLFHVSGTSESQHAVGILEKLVDWHLCDKNSPNDRKKFVKLPQFIARGITASTGSATERTMLHQASTRNSENCFVVLAEADVSKLEEVAGRNVLDKLPSMHVYLGGREIARVPVEGNETAEVLREKITAILSGEVHDRSNHVGG